MRCLYYSQKNHNYLILNHLWGGGNSLKINELPTFIKPLRKN